MDAIELLTQQHRMVEKRFAQFEDAEDDDDKKDIFYAIADDLAVHATIEERHFYPAVKARQTQENIEEAFDEHLTIKRLLLDAMKAVEDPGFDGKVAALQGAVEHHVEEEEGDLFPKAKKLLDEDMLEAIGQAMFADAEDMKDRGEPRKNVKAETEPPAAMP
jgi:hemerythrin superfamily protein